MSRHRNVRNMNWQDEMYDEDDYGQEEDEYENDDCFEDEEQVCIHIDKSTRYQIEEVRAVIGDFSTDEEILNTLEITADHADGDIEQGKVSPTPPIALSERSPIVDNSSIDGIEFNFDVFEGCDCKLTPTALHIKESSKEARKYKNIPKQKQSRRLIINHRNLSDPVFEKTADFVADHNFPQAQIKFPNTDSQQILISKTSTISENAPSLFSMAQSSTKLPQTFGGLLGNAGELSLNLKKPKSSLLSGITMNMKKTSTKPHALSISYESSTVSDSSGKTNLDKKSSIDITVGSTFASSLINYDLSTSISTLTLLSVPNTSEGTRPFQFQTLSPDDIVIEARSKAAERKQTQSKPTTSKSTTAKAPTSLHNMTQEISKISIKDKKLPQKEVTSNTGPQNKKTRPIDIKSEYAKRLREKENINLVVVGHVDAGKSTLMGHFLFLLGQVQERTMKKFEREAEKMKKSSFAFAWVLDATEEERSRGVTIDVAVSSFQTATKKFTLLDAPGHRDFIPNMISGTSQADVALLVVDSQDFETGFKTGGQTKEHALLLRSLGVSNVAVVMNKMDMIQWSKQRFDEIKEAICLFLVQQAGFKSKALSFIPCSGITGENLIKRQVKELSWYSGPTLLQLLDLFQTPTRSIDKPLRVSVVDYFKGGSGGSNSVTITGRIESGGIQIGEQVQVMPLSEFATVKTIDLGDDVVKWAAAGDNVSIGLSGIELSHISTGFILCDPDFPINVTSHFKAQIVTFDINIPLTIGVPVVFHHQSLTEPGFISKLVSVVDKATGEIIKKNPRSLSKNTTAFVEIKLARSCCLELFSESKVLGRFTLRSGTNTVAAGIVTEILSRETRVIVDENV